MIGNASTGSVLEAVSIPSLKHAICITSKVIVENRPNGNRHKIDIVAFKSNQTGIISLKWQQVSGTAEQEIPYDVICHMDVDL